jgi:hypothetical protein
MTMMMKPSDSVATIADTVRAARSREAGEAEARRIVLDFVPQFDAAASSRRGGSCLGSGAFMRAP